MRLFGRRKPLHEQLAAAGGAVVTGFPTGLIGQPPGWDGERRGEPGIHGVPRARKWDAVAVADAPGLTGDSVHFVALPDGTVVVDEDEPDGTVAPLADAIETKLAPPYRAEAVRQGGTWAVAANRIGVVRERGLDGDEAELVVTNAERTLTVDGERRVAVAPALEAAGREHGDEFVLRAHRIDEDLFEVEVSPL